MTVLSDDALQDILENQIPHLFEQKPGLQKRLHHKYLETLDEPIESSSQLQQDLANFQAETKHNFEQVNQRFEQIDQRFDSLEKSIDQRFEQVDQRFDSLEKSIDQRFEQVDQRFEQVDQEFVNLRTEMKEGFKNLERQIDRLGQRWGIRSESVFRETMASILEESFGVKVEKRFIAGEEFDVIISNGDHILVEITASAKRNIKERLERKRTLYITEIGVTPARFLLAVASIHSRRAEALREAGFEVIEPDDDDDE